MATSAPPDVLGQKRGQENSYEFGFGKFLFDVSLYLNNDSVKKLATIFRFHEAEFDKIENDGLTFVRMLEEKGIITPNDISKLIRGLESIDKSGIATKVEDSFERNRIRDDRERTKITTEGRHQETKQMPTDTKQDKQSRKADRQSETKEMDLFTDIFPNPFESWREMPISMRSFSVGMRALCADKSVGLSTETGHKFNRLCDKTKQDALVYVKGVLTVSTTLVRSISEFFEYYIELDYELWSESVSDIVEEVRGFNQCCREVVMMHEDIMVPLKQQEDSANFLLSELMFLTEEYERNKKQQEKAFFFKRNLAKGLDIVPVADVITIVGTTMIPTLKAFIDGLRTAARLFRVIENELTTFQGKGEKAMVNKKKLHYKMMNTKAALIKGHCQTLYSMLPGVRSDFNAIPNHGMDQTYVEKWLERKKEEIRKRYQSGITGQLRKMISYLSMDQAN